jgi:hypothetical protein
MRLASEVALVVDHDDPEGDGAMVSISGRLSNGRIPGSVLEAAVQSDPGYLLFVTADTLVDEVLGIHLVDPGGELLDSGFIGAPYASGAFEALRLEPPDVVNFRFIDDADWWIRVLPRPRPALPFFSGARGAWRGGRWTRHFDIDRNPRRWSRRERMSWERR